MIKYFHRDRLNENHKILYQDLVSAIKNKENSFTFYFCSQEEAHLIVESVLYDHPELFYCVLNFVVYQVLDSNVTITLNYMDVDMELFNSELNKIISVLDEKLVDVVDEFEKVKIIFDYLVRLIDDDTAAGNAFTRINLNDERSTLDFINNHGNAINAYGVIINKKGICMGLSLAFKLIADHYQIECTCCPGDGFSDNDKSKTFNHLLNVIEIDGKRAYLDLLNSRVKGLEMIAYDYFLVNEDLISEFFIPKIDMGCNTLELSFYYKNNLIFNDLQALRHYIESYIFESNNGEIRFLYLNDKVDDKYLTRLISDLLARRIRGYRISNYSVINKKGNCLLIKR